MGEVIIIAGVATIIASLAGLGLAAYLLIKIWKGTL